MWLFRTVCKRLTVSSIRPESNQLRAASADTVGYLQERLVLKDLLEGMHPPNPNPTTKFIDVDHDRQIASPVVPFQDLLPDFTEPAFPLRPRSVGYSPGHIRSKLHTDTHGPKDSLQNKFGISVGERVESPNPDRYDLQTPNDSVILSMPELKTLKVKDVAIFTRGYRRRRRNPSSNLSHKSDDLMIASTADFLSQASNSYDSHSGLNTVDPIATGKAWHKYYVTRKKVRQSSCYSRAILILLLTL
jgi:hypothetical protein